MFLANPRKMFLFWVRRDNLLLSCLLWLQGLKGLERQIARLPVRILDLVMVERICVMKLV